MKAVVMTAAALLTLGVSGVVAADGLALAQKNACLSCHGVDKKIVGPAYKEVAARYKGDKSAAAMLQKKVKEGGKGAWGQIPMPANSQVKDEDLKEIISWVLSL